MKKKDLLGLNNALTMLEGRPYSVKFSYFIAKNKVLIKNEIEPLEEARKASPEFMEYDSKRAELALALADKDEKGQPKIENNNFIIVENIKKFQEDLEKLKDSYTNAISETEKRAKEFNELLEEEVTNYNGPKITLSDIPNSIEPKILEVFITCDLIQE